MDKTTAYSMEPTARTARLDDPDAGRRRAAIEGVRPEVDGGRFPIKRVVGQTVVVEADLFTDGHDRLACVVKYRPEDQEQWEEVPMEPIGNDRWRAEFPISRLVGYRYSVEAWCDRFLTWQSDLQKRYDAAQDLSVELQIGAELVEAAAQRVDGPEQQQLADWAAQLRSWPSPQIVQLALSSALREIMRRHADRRLGTTYGRELKVMVERPRAAFSAWYELFPRSCSPEPGRHGTFRDCKPWLERIARMGFDVVYLPPIHPIGRAHRKGPNNTLVASETDPGSPWAIGGQEGGHKAIHPELGTLEDFRWLVSTAAGLGLEIALDIAFQCSPDHPYVSQHPEWFRSRPDGTIQYAENPPKKYQDIYPFDFETAQWRQLWEELRSVILHWVEQGVHIFRIDNPHTKPFAFWEWVIREVKREHPETIFLSEAFTRPRPMYRLAKGGFSQSYTYFTWRNTKQELTDYVEQLMHTDVREYCRPNFWPNTPDILPEFLQYGGRPAFMQRLVLAATLSGNYGVYGPPFEYSVEEPREPGSEEYRDSEKYEIRHWDMSRAGGLEHFMRRVNEIRRQHPALQNDWSVQFQEVDNPQILAYTKRSSLESSDLLLVVVNLDPFHKQTGFVEISSEALDLSHNAPYQVHDLLGDGRYLWQGSRNYVELDPRVAPAQIFQVRRRVRTERQFEYFM